jgi:hypothetical protein
MTHKLIKTKHYLLVVDDSDMVGKGYRLDITRMSVGIIDDDFLYNSRKDWFKKIIAHLPLNDSPILEGVDLLPPIEDDVEEAERKFTEVLDSETKQVYDKMLLDATEHGFVIGYNKAREKYKYTEEHMRKIAQFITDYAIYDLDDNYFKENYGVSVDGVNIKDVVEKYIESFHQYPTEFECELVTTAQDIQWMGKYK